MFLLNLSYTTLYLRYRAGSRPNKNGNEPPHRSIGSAISRFRLRERLIMIAKVLVIMFSEVGTEQLNDIRTNMEI